ncbi:hypothetical protein OMD46_08710 [Pseudomonas sp. MDMC_285]|nr:hypothetical protein [Pseudomonas sp. MDMC_285]
MLFVIHLLASAGLAWSLGAGHLGGGLLAFALLYLIARLLGLAVQRLGRYARSLEHGVSFCLWFIAQVFSRLTTSPFWSLHAGSTWSRQCLPTR